MNTYYSTQDIEREHQGHWFTPSTKRFFRSRIGSQVYQGLGGIYFVSSEQFMGARGDSKPRRFTVRRYDPNTDQIETAGPFNELTRSQAYSRAKRYAVEGMTVTRD